MKAALEEIANEYRWGIREYLTGAGESALRRAYEIGRKSLAQGVGVLDMAQMHKQCVADILGPERPEIAASPSRLRALDFFSESLSAFEMALRGYRETNAQLQRNLNDVLEAQRLLREQNEGLILANEAAEQERRRYQELLEFVPHACLLTGLDGTILEANSAAGRLLGALRESLAGRNLLSFVNEETECRAELERIRTGILERREDWLLTVKSGGSEPALVAATVAAQHRGERTRWLFQDVTERRRALEAREHALAGRTETTADRRFEFLAEASTLLASSQDYETTLAGVAQLAVPDLADCCFIHVLEAEGSVWQVAAVVSEEVRAGSTADLTPLLRPHRSQNPELFTKMRRVEILEPVAHDWLARFLDCGEHAALIRTLALQSAVIAPMLIGDRILGTLSLMSAQPGRTAADRAVAEDLARRCALALDNGRLYREVLQERDRAEKANRAKDEFLAILSHELRNPLTPIVGWARILKSHEKIRQDPFLAEAINALDRSSRHISRLVGDCLDLTRISRGTIELDKCTIDLNQVVKASVEIVAETVAEKGIALESEPPPQPLWVLADATRMQQVVMNLLLNAVTYTDPGGWIRIRALQNGDEAEIAVEDNGAGIAPNRLEEIFRPFSVSTKSWLGSKSGMGLGLAIARRIVELHGGSIRAESDGPGRGSAFRIRLPLTAPKTMERLSRGPRPAAGRKGPEGLRVLVVEDSPDILFLMRLELENLGYEVITAPNGKEALEAATRDRPDVILSDIKMPGIDGYELIRRIRAVPELATVPAIALTGFGMQADVERAVLSGFDDSLTKPAEAREMDERIRRITRSRKLPAPTEPEN